MAALQRSVTDALRTHHMLLASGLAFGIVVALLVDLQMGFARQRPRPLPAASTFPYY